jgi:hypothetical protein
MSKLTLLLLLALQAIHFKAEAWLSYSNGRIDRALYDYHDPKLVVSGKITNITEQDTTGKSILFWDGPTGPESIEFTVEHVIMGKTIYTDMRLEIPVHSFNWPVDLVKLQKDQHCTLILSVSEGKISECAISVVVPFNEDIFQSFPQTELAVANNGITRKFLEQQLLAELKIEKNIKRQQALLEQIGPITSAKSETDVAVFLKSENEWVKRAALAALVFSTQKKVYVDELALDINMFFSKYTTNEKMIRGNLEYSNYSAWYLYYRFVFFLDPDQRKWGSRWDENEARTNEILVKKLNDTGHLSKKVQAALKC